MKALLELRIPEATAKKYLEPGEGSVVGGIARKVAYPVGDERLAHLAKINRAMKDRGDMLFTSWRIRRKYTAKEIREAEMLYLIIEASTESSGLEDGTIYDESQGCPHCGRGRVQVSNLRIDTSSLSSDVNIAHTTSRDELIVSDSVARVIEQYSGDSLTFRPVQTQREDFRRWTQLVLPMQGAGVHVLPRTVFGVDPFDLDEEGRFRCPLGHVAGLNVLSETWIDSESLRSDFQFSEEFVGIHRGVLHPFPLIFITPTLWQELVEVRINGCSVEVAHLSG